MAKKSNFGSVEQLPSGRIRARYRNPLNTTQWINAPQTFPTRLDARTWLTRIDADISRGMWKHPDQVAAETLAAEEAAKAAEQQAASDAYTVNQWVTVWLERLDGQTETGDKSPATARTYRNRLKRFQTIYGDRPIRSITNNDIISFWDGLADERNDKGKPLAGNTRNATVTTVVKCINDAYPRGIILQELDPKIDRASKKRINPLEYVATPEEVAAMAEFAAPRPALAIMLAYHCGLRSGEIRALRRRDLILKAKDGEQPRVLVRRTATRSSSGSEEVKDVPKSDAGNREVPLNPAMVTYLQKYVTDNSITRQDDLLIHSVNNSKRAIKGEELLTGPRGFHAARKHVKLHASLNRLHDLRACFLTRFGRIPGASLKDIMAVGGHSDPGAAMVYQVAERDRIANLVEAMDTGTKNGATVHALKPAANH